MVDYKEKLFDVVIRSFVKELNQRFSSECCTILNAMAAFFPTLADFLNTDVMRPFVNFYELRSDLLKSECEVFAVQFAKAGTNCKNLQVLRILENHKECYTQLHKAYHIAWTIPITTAENERSFSCLKRVKTYLSIVINDERFGNLGTLSINRERTSKIDMEEVVDQFSELSNRRIVLQ